ncbi:MAG: alpha-xenorhabdolysin family binary toxin subunit A [Halanaerobiales bacterium]|nr:alpha-xenorhabdolysin family binary toxin subunit A [Halanaerobiales bacterium]
MTTAIKKPNIGPGGLTQKGQKNPFLLSKAEWINVQVYVQDGLSLPVNTSELSELLFGDGSSSVSDFQDLLQEFIVVHGHCNTWKTETYPNTINLANNIVHYASKATVYYGALNEVVEEYCNIKFSENPNKEVLNMLKQKMKGIVQILGKSAKDYATNADNVQKEISTFLDLCTKDQNDMKSLSKTYNQKYGKNSEQVQTLRKQIKEFRSEVDKLQKEYNRDVIIEATSATYGWIPIAGWIAAAIVDGVFAKQMKELKKSINNLKDKIDKDNKIIRRDINLMNAIDIAENSLKTILTDLQNALPVIEKIKGIWSSIYSDLVNIENVIDEDISKVPPFLKDCGIPLAIKDWKKVGQEADSFRVNAYVQFQKK